MNNNKLKMIVADRMAGVLKDNLVKKANTTSCALWYEPKAPSKLLKYKK